MPMPSVYLDTNIISGLAKGEFEQPTIDAILEITGQSKDGRVSLFTSEITAEELNHIPAEYRWQHYVIYNLISNVAFAPERLPSNLILQGFGGGSIITQGFGPGPKHPIVCKLEAIIPTVSKTERAFARTNDILHLYQCHAANIRYFLTQDAHTILRHRKELLAVGINATSGIELLEKLRGA
jgi:predicted nucleic acid-binding protein